MGKVKDVSSYFEGNPLKIVQIQAALRRHPWCQPFEVRRDAELLYNAHNGFGLRNRWCDEGIASFEEYVQRRGGMNNFLKTPPCLLTGSLAIVALIQSPEFDIANIERIRADVAKPYGIHVPDGRNVAEFLFRNEMEEDDKNIVRSMTGKKRISQTVVDSISNLYAIADLTPLEKPPDHENNTPDLQLNEEGFEDFTHGRLPELGVIVQSVREFVSEHRERRLKKGNSNDKKKTKASSSKTKETDDESLDNFRDNLRELARRQKSVKNSTNDPCVNTPENHRVIMGAVTHLLRKYGMEDSFPPPASKRRREDSRDDRPTNSSQGPSSTWSQSQVPRRRPAMKFAARRKIFVLDESDESSSPSESPSKNSNKTDYHLSLLEREDEDIALGRTDSLPLPIQPPGRQQTPPSSSKEQPSSTHEATSTLMTPALHGCQPSQPITEKSYGHQTKPPCSLQTEKQSSATREETTPPPSPLHGDKTWEPSPSSPVQSLSTRHRLTVKDKDVATDDGENKKKANGKRKAIDEEEKETVPPKKKAKEKRRNDKNDEKATKGNKMDFLLLILFIMLFVSIAWACLVLTGSYKKLLDVTYTG